MDITIESLQTKLPINTARAKKIIQKIIKRERLSVEHLSYTFVTRQKIKQLNKKFLKREYTTDVLAFDLNYSEQWTVNSGQRMKYSIHPQFTVHCSQSTKKNISGDIIISADAAIAQSKEYGTSAAYELVLYMVHGLLHLLGYDDHAPRDIQKMRRKEARVMDYLQKDHLKIVV